jgi:hypothetical protein
MERNRHTVTVMGFSMHEHAVDSKFLARDLRFESTGPRFKLLFLKGAVGVITAVEVEVVVTTSTLTLVEVLVVWMVVEVTMGDNG